jgi:hypothetical protein
MNRSERARLTKLDGILARHDAAEKQALLDLRNAGFNVRGIAQARRIQAEYREQARIAAHAVERMSAIASGRKTA